MIFGAERLAGRQMEKWMDEWIDAHRRMNGWVDGWMDRQTHGLMDGVTDGWMDALQSWRLIRFMNDTIISQSVCLSIPSFSLS